MSGESRLVVGLVRGCHGLRGTLRVEPLTDRVERRFAPGAWLYVEGTDRRLTVAAAGTAEVGWRLRFEEVPDRTAAEQLVGAYLEAEVGPEDRLGQGEYYWHEVVGTAVTDLDGAPLGNVADVYRTGGAEVLLVRGPRGELDVPLVRPIVRVFAPDRGEIVVDGEALGLRGEPSGEGEVGEAGEAGEQRPDAGA